MSSSPHQIHASDVAVIVAAKNEEKNIKSCVDSILKSTKGEAQLIVVNDGSTDQTGAILESYGSAISVITTTGLGPSVARNQAMHSTQKPYVAFADADCTVDVRWIEKLVKGLSVHESQYVSVGGVQEMHPQAGIWDLFHASLLECMGFVSDYVHEGKELKVVKHNPTCNVLYIKNEVLQVDGFDPKLWPCEDLDLDIRLAKLGKKFLFTPDAIIYHHRPDSFFKFMKMMFRYGFGHAQIVKKHGLCQKIHAVPILLILGMVFLFWDASHMWRFSSDYRIYLVPYAILVWRSKSLIRALIYGFYLIPTIAFWNIGFFMGLFQKMKITTK